MAREEGASRGEGNLAPTRYEWGRAWAAGSESGAGGRWRLRVDLNRGREGRGVELGFVLAW